MNRALILFAHGARDPEWAKPFERLRAAVKQQQPDTAVEIAYLEFMQPDLPLAVDRLIESGVRQIDIVPAFMAQGGHLKRDLPLLVKDVQTRHPHASFILHPALGESQAVLDAMAAHVAGLGLIKA
jgi:sirohydrochlorin cobaltochelatase